MVKGKFHITYDFIGNIFRASTRGSSPGNHSLLDGVYAFIGSVRSFSDYVLYHHIYLACSDCSAVVAS